MGDVVGLSTEDITDGPLAGRTALYAEIEPTARMMSLLNDGKKIYSSIELEPQSTITGGPYLRGLAMTDTPASLGTERLAFAAQQRMQLMTFNCQQGDVAMFTAAMESELIELTEQRQEEGTQWFNRVMGLLAVDAKRMTPVSPVFRKRWKVSQRHRPTLSTVLMCWKPAINRTARKSLY